MEFKTHNTGVRWKEGDGTSSQGGICATYWELKKIFGKPDPGDQHDTDAEWLIKFADGTIAAIYNYKDGVSYLGKDGTPKTKITDWNIGGKRNQKAEERVNEALKEYRERK